ncbi:MAG: hypothetical protein ACH349_05810 [Candidatus Rhabdochlamydia sp.]
MHCLIQCCCIDRWIGHQNYTEGHEGVLKQFIDLPNGLPSHDTMTRWGCVKNA